MKKITLFLIAFLTIKAVTAQGNFENLTSKLDSMGKDYFKGYLGIPGYSSFSTNGATFVNRNDTSAFGDFWSGWAISRLKDSMSIAYDTNDCAAITAVGQSGSSVYATAFLSLDPNENKIRFNNVQLGVLGFFITNSTITYRSMQNGDAFSKKFGGLTGNDPDYFRVIINGWQNGVLLNDSVVFYLADFRDTNNTNDYIVNDWRYVNLNGLVNDSLTYRLESSDTSAWGMNTPAFFCVDDFLYIPEGVSDINTNPNIQLYPNPFVENIVLSNQSNELSTFTIFQLNGQLMSRIKVAKNEHVSVNTNSWSTGEYYVKVKSASGEYFYKIVK